MRTRSLIAAVFILAGLPVLAEDRHQSYITYDDSDSILVQDDGREVDARVNLPVYPGDEVRAARRGRTELRLADGTILALDRDSVVRFRSMLLNFEEGGDQTVAELASGHVMVYRRYQGSEPLRLDASNASFISERESIYGVETTSRGVDIATVFEGSVEVRTPSGSTQLRAGDRAKIDVTGVYERRAISNVAATEFERWFLARAERYANKESRHLDASLAYAEDDLNEHGRWVYVNDYNTWAWSPYVSAGWRPYYYGYWGWGANGASWISYEPWGWVPYHYGRWSYVARHGWMWMPGNVYSPAWVYWAWGPSWVGWVPWGWYDYHPGYHGWLHDPFYNPRIYANYGFRGHISVSTGDLSAYTVVDSRTLFSNRADRAALTADAIRDRLARDGGRAMFTNQPTRMNRTDMKDPSTAVDRIIRGSRDGSGTGSVGAGSSGDLTQFFQRDPALSQDVRDRVTRGQTGTRGGTTGTRGGNTMPSTIGGTPATGTSTMPGRGGVRGGGGLGGTIDRPGTGSGGSTTPSTGGTVPRGGGTSTVPRGGGSTTGGSSSSDNDTSDRPATNRPRVGTSPRTQEPDTPSEPSPRGGADTSTVDRPGSGGSASTSGGDWRSRPVRGGSSSGSSDNTTSSPRSTTRGGGDDPVSRPSSSGNTSSSTPTRGSSDGSWRGAGDTVRRVIGSIGGARLTPSDDRGSSSSGSNRGSTRSGSSSGSSSTPSTRSGSSSGSSSTPSTRSGGSGSVNRPSSGSSSSGSSSSGSSSSGSSSSGSSKGSSSSSSSSPSPRSDSGGGKVDRGGN